MTTEMAPDAQFEELVERVVATTIFNEPFKSHTELHTATRSHDWLQDRPVQESRIVDHPAGGITQEWVTVPEARENPAPTREPGGLSDQPTATAALGFTEFGERTDRPGLFRRIRNATRSN